VEVLLGSSVIVLWICAVTVRALSSRSGASRVAQFIYLMLQYKKIQDVIDTITSKVVLILGRFIPDRIVVLDAIRDHLRSRNYLSVLFDFEPTSRDLTETVSTLVHIARFVIAPLCP